MKKLLILSAIVLFAACDAPKPVETKESVDSTIVKTDSVKVVVDSCK